MNNGKYGNELTDKICKLFETDSYTVREICEIVGINESTYYFWCDNHLEFLEAIKRAKEVYQAKRLKECEKSLNKLVEGYEYEEVTTEYKIVGDSDVPIGNKKIVKKHVAPNLGAIIHYQTNKDPQNWKNKQSTDVTTNGESINNAIQISVINTEKLPTAEDEVNLS